MEHRARSGTVHVEERGQAWSTAGTVLYLTSTQRWTSVKLVISSLIF